MGEEGKWGVLRWRLGALGAVEQGRAVARGRLAVAALLAAAHAHDLGVDGRADAVVHLAVDLGQGVACAQDAVFRSQGEN